MLYHRKATYPQFPTCVSSSVAAFPLSKSRAVTSCITRYQVPVEGRTQITSMCGGGRRLSQVFCFPAAVIPGAAHTWPGMKSPTNKWDHAHLERVSALKRRRSMELGIFTMLGHSAFTKCNGGWAAGDVGGGCVGCRTYDV